MRKNQLFIFIYKSFKETRCNIQCPFSFSVFIILNSKRRKKKVHVASPHHHPETTHKNLWYKYTNHKSVSESYQSTYFPKSLLCISDHSTKQFAPTFTAEALIGDVPTSKSFRQSVLISLWSTQLPKVAVITTGEARSPLALPRGVSAKFPPSVINKCCVRQRHESAGSRMQAAAADPRTPALRFSLKERSCGLYFSRGCF